MQSTIYSFCFQFSSDYLETCTVCSSTITSLYFIQTQTQLYFSLENLRISMALAENDEQRYMCVTEIIHSIIYTEGIPFKLM